MGRFGLMAGALSQGLEQGLAGANQGLIQGEAIRHGRSQEDLQQAHLGMQQQQLTNHLAQQAFQNYLAQQQLGLHQGQLDWQRQHGGAELALKAATEQRHQELLPHEIKYKQASADWMTQRPEIGWDRNRVMQDRTDAMREHWSRVGKDVQGRLDMAQKRLELAQKSLSMRMTPQQRVAMTQLQSRLHDARQKLNIATDPMRAGVPGMPTPDQLMAEIAAMENEIGQVAGMPGPLGQQQPQGGPATPLAHPGAVNLGDIYRQLGLRQPGMGGK